MAKKTYTYDNVDLSYFETAQSILAITQTIHCSSEKLFDIFEDENSWPIWAPTIAKIVWTSEKPFGIGTTRTAHLKGGIYGEEEFIAWERGKLMAFKFTTGTVPTKAFAEHYAVKEISENVCELTWTVAMTPNTIGKIFMPITQPFLKWYLQKILKNLDKYAQERT